MMHDLQFDNAGLREAVSPQAWDAAFADASKGRRELDSRAGAGREFLGWLDLPGRALETVDAINATAARIRAQSDALVVVGIGGSYLGARAAIDACRAPFDASGPEILYAGHNISGAWLKGLMAHLDGRDFSINVISKSGTTTEPAIAFRLLRGLLIDRYGPERARERIIATTDAARGALRHMADEEGWESWVIPDDVGGRFSVLTPVGLLPIAAAGVDIRALCEGADEMRALLAAADDAACPALRYAASRLAMYRAGKSVEILAGFEPALATLAEWWKQLFGECEGKQGRGLFPASVSNTTDLHSLGQYIQDGARILFETFLVTREARDDVTVPRLANDGDGLNYLAGKSLHHINSQAWKGTEEAHRAGGAPSATISIADLSAHSIGALIYFFEYAVGISGYALGINPFDQPGVEEYKKNMFRLLGK